MASQQTTNGVDRTTSIDFTSFSNIINGKKTQTKEWRHGINPSTLEENPAVPVSTPEDVENAVKAARAAAPGWADTPLSERQAAVLAFSQALASHKSEFAELLTREQGKPLPIATDEVQRGEHWLAVQAKLPFPEDVVEETADQKIVTRYTPLGVAVAIVPWNYPIVLACGKISPALVTGNALILKPSPFTPYTALKMAELGQQFFPPGVLQALSGDDHLGPWLTEHPGIDKVSFTGSTVTGRKVMASCARTLKRVTLELGGNDAAVVFPDVDVAATAGKVTTLALLNSGQICATIKRIYVHASIYQEFLAAMVQTLKQFKVGDGFDSEVFIGPVQNATQFERVKGFLAEVAEQHLKTLTGNASKGSGYFVTPTIVDNPPDHARIVTEEPFGPVFPVMSWETEEEVLARANDSPWGLGASIWSKDGEKANQMAQKMKAGTVWINDHLILRPDAAFGGFGQSGIGSEWGVAGLRAYCNTQTLYLQKKSKL